MYLDAVKSAVGTAVETNGNGFYKSDEVFEKWRNWYASEISHHGKMCCEIAREWITATDFSELGGSSIYTGPRWLRLKFNWGASSFPIYWCEAARKITLDCGALAALAAEIFTVRGVKNFRVQMVQRYSEDSTSQWSSSWYDTDEQLRWMDNDLIYHEGCAIIPENNDIKIWDASAGWWIDPKTKDGYGSLLAIRLSANFTPANADFVWGTHILKFNEWTKIN